MKKLLTRLTPVAATLLLSLGAASNANAAEEKQLTVNGFVDMSALYTDNDDDSDSVFGVD
ncbi:hypothetical protein [Psychrosphaera algicola]|uniref:Porin n=1 Tax=Psychrosphaera algicola TaxID=3023714 RepID=A0ABT5FIS7_9GAMM|nr:hypothetical protein [Psychrosphaera sp. G1-22]MDC2891103.1 hypothetical protein [Psychrosphaera sp. G1-22]